MDHLEDILIYRNILERCPNPADDRYAPGDFIVKIGEYFLNAPYVGGSLEHDGPERLTVNLRTFDCFTFVETCLALARHLLSQKDAWQDFPDLLLRIRYRGGILNGYASRLHYFSDWLDDNSRKRILQDMTPAFGGMPCIKKINYMTQHPDFYPALSNPVILKQMTEIEKALTDRPRYVMPLSVLADREGLIKAGDIIGIAASEEGLDVLHAGLAVRHEGTLHLLHASQQAGRVIASPESLDTYLRQGKSRAGILVGRMNAL